MVIMLNVITPHTSVNVSLALLVFVELTMVVSVLFKMVPVLNPTTPVNLVPVLVPQNQTLLSVLDSELLVALSLKLITVVIPEQ
jgi:hypothetical protein